MIPMRERRRKTMASYQKAEQAPDPNQPPVGPPAKENNRETLNTEVLAKFVEAATSVGYSKGVEALAERLIARLATLAEASGSTAFQPKEAELVRSYDVLRRELAGPGDANAPV